MKFLLLLFSLLLLNCTTPNQIFESSVFLNGEGGYACYRIPAIIQTPQGTLMAFAEGRKTGCSDFGDVDLLLKTSKDNGLHWSKAQVVAEFDSLQAGNPAPVIDLFDANYPEGRVFLFYNTGTASEHNVRLGKGTREVLYITSSNEGVDWSQPINITPQVHFNKNAGKASKDWRTHATTPGHAFQFKNLPYQGRLYIPANHSQGPPQEGFNEYRAYGFYTDDHGQTFRVSPDLKTPSSNEAIGVELPSGQLMLNVREQNGATKTRLIALSDSGGENWDNEYFDQALISPVCQSSLLVFEGLKDTLLLYSGPNSKSKRVKMTIKGSQDEGKSWPYQKEIFSGTAAYSDLVQIDVNTIGLFYEKEGSGLFFKNLPLNDLKK